MERLDKILLNFLFYVCAILMLIMVASVTAQVISRYIFENPFSWTEELSRYTFVWVTFLGMAVAIKNGEHIALDILEKSLKGVSQKTIKLINKLLLLSFASIWTYSGYKFVGLGMGQKSPSLGLPMEIVYLVIPISGILLIYFIISEAVQSTRTERGIL